jgi:hypothetical protein
MVWEEQEADKMMYRLLVDMHQMDGLPVLIKIEVMNLVSSSI